MLQQVPGFRANISVGAHWIVECFEHFHANGEKCLLNGRREFCGHIFHDTRLKWIEDYNNLVVTAGLDELLNNTFNAVPADVNWYVGLKDTGTVAAGDTMASHAGWATITPYSDANDPAWTKNGASSSGAMSNSSSKAVFNINATDTVFGAFLKDNNTKGGATGTLFGAGDFTSSRNVESGDTLNVQIDLSVTAA